MASNKDKLIASAQKLVEKGQYDKAVKEYLKVAAEDDKDPRSWLKIGDLYVRLSRTKEAIDAYLKSAQVYSDTGFYYKAASVYKQIVKLDPKRVDINLRLAELYQQMNLVSDALAQYDIVAGAYQQEGKMRDALALMKAMVELEPDNVAARVKLAEGYSSEKMTAEAVAEFTRAAETLKDLGRSDDYVKVAERLLFHTPDNKGLAREIARLYVERNEARRALPILHTTYKSNPRDAETLELLARAFEALGQTTKAVSVLKELARIHGQDGDGERQGAALREVRRLAPDDPDASGVVQAPMARGGTSARIAAVMVEPDFSRPASPPVAVPRASVVPQTPPARASISPPPSPLPVQARQAETVAAAQRAFVATMTPTAPGPVEPVTAPGTPSAMPSTPRPARTPYGLGPTFAEDAQGEDSTTTTTPDAEEQIARVLAETDIYRKYGLHAKALEHIQRVFELQPGHVPAREKIVQLLVELKHPDEAIAQLWQLYHHEGPTLKGQSYLEDILAVRSDEREARRLLDELKVPPPLPPTPAGETPMPADTDEIGEAEILDEESLELVEEELPVVVEASADAPAETPDAIGEPVEDRFAADLAGVSETGPTRVRLAADDAQPVSSFVPPRRPAVVPRTFADDVADATGSPTPSISTPGATAFEGATPPTNGGPRQPSTIEEALDLAEAYVASRRYDDARARLHAILAVHPRHPIATARLGELDRLESAVRAPDPPVDAAQFVAAAHAALATPAAVPAVVADEPSLVRGPTRVTAEVAGADDEPSKNIAVEDFDTHYDLGIAYKEMGLLDDAIGEFRLVQRDPAREVSCHMMIGLCLVEKGRLTDSISEFKKGLYAERIEEREALALYFELGSAYERLSDGKEALYYFEKVHKRDPGFRDVERRVLSLRAAAAPPRDEIDAALDSLGEGARRAK